MPTCGRYATFRGGSAVSLRRGAKSWRSLGMVMIGDKIVEFLGMSEALFTIFIYIRSELCRHSSLSSGDTAAEKGVCVLTTSRVGL